MTLKTYAATAALAIAMVATSAAADTFRFELNGTHRAVWTIDTATPVTEYADGEFASYGAVIGNFSDLPGFSPASNYVAQIDFYTTAGTLEGGFYIDDFFGRTAGETERPILTTNGPSVITGPTSAPTFLTGYYVFTATNATQDPYSLTISAVPEPSSWAMMLSGFGLIGAALRRRAKQATTRLA